MKRTMSDFLAWSIATFIVVLGVGSWIVNIVKLFGATGMGECAVRIAGILVPPLGIILGWV